jgi:hypothetical protein
MGERDEALRRAQQTLRRLQHEVRTPISQIIGYAELLEEELADRGAEHLAPDLHKIRHAAERLLDLADGRLRDEQDPGAPALTAEAVEPEAAELEAHAARALGREGRAHILTSWWWTRTRTTASCWRGASSGRASGWRPRATASRRCAASTPTSPTWCCSRW